ncbi:MAG: (deoxy)nucleoside triphosphate pyrophosphohydrolase, partial [Firmicutes bacterium]|nr:(deoxy)nucleoside triphosphate pyrophosphohydrolase [Bacillota bacterium]
DKLFATQRGYGDFAGGWEFPGGKVEPGESEREAVARELKEELEMDVTVGELFDVVEYDYPEFHLSMKCYLCTAGQGGYVLKEHQDARWLSRATIDEVEWLPADLGLIKKVKEWLL